MDASTRERLGAAFDRAASSYAVSRPGYPEAAVDWLLDPDAGTRAAAGTNATGGVLDLGAGSGSLTHQLAARVRRVVAAEPSLNLLRELSLEPPSSGMVQAAAEQLPFDAGVFDVVTVATAFHWFDSDRALPEIARVLREGGGLGLIWNVRSRTEPWTRALSALLRSVRPASLSGDWGAGSAQALDDSPWFAPPSYAEFPHGQRLGRSALMELVGSRSYVIALDEPQRVSLLAEVGDLFDITAGKALTLDLPYTSRCWRAVSTRPVCD